ncbi:MAG: trypsin-like peptidase domain-containing protein [Candidatus Sericytochromatia bacterium]|nr:trypsin-like peptidase domain-containing protein [Candidatus Sericytochromatia bacterium]
MTTPPRRTARRLLLLAALLVAPGLAAPPARAAGLPAIADLVERVDGAVVSIDTVARSLRDPFYELFPDDGPGVPDQKGVGSGFIIDPDGLIVTNHHVVRGAIAIRVTTAQGNTYPARVVGTDATTDLALLRVQARGLPALRFRDGEQPRVGEWVVAIGSPLGLSHTVSAGIISATNRGIALSDRVNYLQTDAAINPGNSGGPLLDMEGRVVGVNVAVAARGQGIGFAIPAWTARPVIEQLRTRGRVERAWLGVSIRDARAGDDRGVLVVGLAPGGPARRAGLLPGDVVLRVDNQPVRTARDLLTYLNTRVVGSRVTLLVAREGQRVAVGVVLQAVPEAVPRR